ncbi:hypothetical protein ACNKHX_24900 [Shigella flexneri]
MMVNAPKKVCAPTSRGSAVHQSIDLRQRRVPIYGLMEDAATAEEFPVPQSGSGSIIKKRQQWQTGDQRPSSARCWVKR